MVGSVFDLDGDLAIDFSGLEVDFTERTLGRLLYQFRGSPVMVNLNTKLAELEQLTYDEAINTLRGRTIAEAQGFNLDVIGRIVGQPRILLNAETKAWFTPDTAFRPDNVPIWVTNAPLFGDLPATDGEFRRLILSKIFKNHVKAGSVPEIIQFVYLLTGEYISVKREGPMELSFIVPSAMKVNDVLTIIAVGDDKTADRKYLTPLPVTARLANIYYRPRNGFKPDCGGGRVDFAAVSVRVPIGVFALLL